MVQQVLDLLTRPELVYGGLGLAIFLGLFWTLRGAPIGQKAAVEPDEAPSAGARDRVVLMAIVGFLLILAGGVVLARSGVPWSVPLFVAGIGLTSWLIRSNATYRHVSPTLRRVVDFGDTALAASLIAGILIVANVFAFKYGGRPIDFTREGAFTLAPASVTAVRDTPKSIRFTLVMGKQQRSRLLRDRIRQLVDLYRAVDPAKVEVVDIDAFSQSQAATFDALVKRVPELGLIRGDGVLIESGEGENPPRTVLGLAEMFRDPTPEGPEGRFTTAFVGEDAITNNLILLREGKPTRIGFTRGHGEPSIASTDPRQPGLGIWRTRLAAVGADAVEVDLVAGDVPPGIAILGVVAPSPRSPFQPEEVDRLRKFMTGGGTMLLLANSIEKTGLEPLIAPYNIAFDPGIIVDPVLNLSQRSDLVVTPPLGPEGGPLLAGMAGMRVLLPSASPIRVVGAGVPKPGEPRPTVNGGVVNLPFLRTGPASWAETNLASRRPEFDKDADIKGPIAVGIAAQEAKGLREGKPRPLLVAISCGQVATNPALDMFPDNADLVMNAFQWLRGEAGSVGGVAPKLYTPLAFTADATLRQRLHLVPTIAATILLLGVGGVTWLARRA